MGKAEQKLCLGLWSGYQLRHCSQLVPLLFHSCFISHNGDTFFFLSSVNQHPCRTEEVEGANLSKAGSRYPVILLFFFPFLYCMSLVSTVFI